MTDTDRAVGIYWDFENVHACLVDDANGDGSYRSGRFKAQDPVVDIARVVAFAAAHGRIAVHRAYANWQYFIKYKDELQEHAIDLVQLFPLTGTKNGADIRLVLDVAEDLERQPGLTDVVVVGSDSDFTALAQRCRAYGRRFIGIGTARNIARGYPSACDEFRRYQDLPAASRRPAAGAATDAGPDSVRQGSVPQDRAPQDGAGPEYSGQARGQADLAHAADLVVAAIRRLAADSGEPWVLKAAVRPMMRKLDPDFTESDLGFVGFTALAGALGEWIAERRGRCDHELAVRADLPLRLLPDAAGHRPAMSAVAAAGQEVPAPRSVPGSEPAPCQPRPPAA